MTAAEILLKIKALFERKGVDDAKEAVDSLGNAGKEAGAAASEGMSDAVDAAKEAGEAASEGMGKVADAAGEAGDALRQAGDSAGQMGNQTASAATLSAGNIGKVTAVVTSLAGIVKMVTEAMVEGQHVMEGIKVDNLAAGVESNREAVERLARAYESASKMRALLASAQTAGIDMLRQEQLASLELAKARELASAKDDDERRRIELRYAAQSREIGSERDADAAKARMAQLRAEREEIDRQIADRKEQLADEEAAAAKVGRAFFVKNAEAGEKESSYWTNMPITGAFGLKKNAEMTRAEADRLQAAFEEGAAQIRASVDAIAELERRREENDLETRRAMSDLQVTRTMQQAGAISDATASRDLEKAIADRKAEEKRRREAEERAARRKAEADRLNAGIEANNERGEELQRKYQEVRETYAPKLAAARERAQVERQSAASAARAFGAFRREGTDSTVGGYDKVVASANQRAQSAASELASMERELAATLDAITAELRRLKEDSKNKAKQIRSLPN